MIYSFVNSFVKIFLSFFEAIRKSLCIFDIFQHLYHCILPIITGRMQDKKQYSQKTHSQTTKN